MHRLQVRERGGSDLTLVRSVGAVGDEVAPKLALRRRDRRIYPPSRHTEAFGVELKMMDERLHGALHDFAPGRHDLVVRDAHRALPFGQPQLLQALLHDANRLPHLLHADAISVIAIPVLTDGDVEVELAVAFVGLRFAQVPGCTRAANHHPGKAPVPRILKLDHRDPDVALLEDAILGRQAPDVFADCTHWLANTPATGSYL